jgi:hypothetical protein
VGGVVDVRMVRAHVGADLGVQALEGNVVAIRMRELTADEDLTKKGEARDETTPLADVPERATIGLWLPFRRLEGGRLGSEPVDFDRPGPVEFSRN